MIRMPVLALEALRIYRGTSFHLNIRNTITSVGRDYANEIDPVLHTGRKLGIASRAFLK
jgi:hypothetical protein